MSGVLEEAGCRRGGAPRIKKESGVKGGAPRIKGGAPHIKGGAPHIKKESGVTVGLLLLYVRNNRYFLDAAFLASRFMLRSYIIGVPMKIEA